MRILLSILLLLCLLSLSGCGPVTSEIHEGDNRLNYKSIFNEDVPSDVEVVNSLYVTYQPTFRLMVITTPDYEIELIATKQWIEKEAKQLWLGRLDDFSTRLAIERRVKQRGREWYVPKDISEYESYIDASSVGYVQMLVDKTPVTDNHYRVFLSKH
jgi:hypothetical protein